MPIPDIKRLLPPSIVVAIKRWKRHRMLQNFKPYTVSHTYGGWPLTIRIADPMAQGWYDKPWTTLPEITKLRNGALRRGARVFDLGAHHGVVAAMLASEVGPTGTVVAVEADPHNAHCAQTNAKLNHLDQITVVQSAISDSNDDLVFYRGLNGSVSTGDQKREEIRVAATTIDDLTVTYGQPDVLFIDIEGFEAKALHAASRTLAAKPDCFVEVHTGCGLEEYGDSVADVLAFFDDSYDLQFATPAAPEFQPLDQAQLPTTRFYLVATQPRSTN